MLGLKVRRFRGAFDDVYFNHNDTYEAHTRITFSLWRIKEASESEHYAIDKFYDYISDLRSKYPDDTVIAKLTYNELKEPIE